jgi:hypothetical protein
MTANGFPLVAVMLGWPAVLMSIVLVFFGIARRRVRVAVVGGVVALLFLLYLFASPRVGWLSLVVGAVCLGSSLAVARSHRGLAVAMAMPFAALAGFVGWIVLNQ